MPRENNISLWIHVHVPLCCPGAVTAALLLGFARHSKPLAVSLHRVLAAGGGGLGAA